MSIPDENDQWKSAREMLGKGRLSVVMPAYCLGGTIAGNIEKVASVLEGKVDYEIVPVDDGSPDNTAEGIKAAAAANPRVKPVFVAVNAGKGNALKEGFRASTGDFVLLLDGDLDLLPSRIPDFFDSMAKHGSDIVLGSKRHSKSNVQYPWHRRLASVVYYTLVRILVGLPVTDTQVGMKLFRREVLGAALDRMLVKAFAFDLELLAIAYGRGAKISEAPVTLKFGEKFGCLKPTAVKSVMMDTLAIFYRLRLLKYYAKVEVPPPLEKKPLVSVVIACPNDSWMLRQCLAALEKQTYRDFEVIVLPDELPGQNPDIRTGEPSNSQLSTSNLQLQTYNFKLSTIPTGKVRPAEKRNKGIAEAKGELVAFIDDDAYPDPHWIEFAVKYFAIDDVGAVGGPGVTPPDDGFMARMGGRVYANPLVSGNYRYRYVGGRTLRQIDDYPSCNLFVRTSLLRSFNGYRTDFWPGEDTLLCRDILAAGKRIVYDPWTTVFHHRRALFGAHLRQLGRYAFHRGYFCKRFPENSLHFSYFVPTLFVVYLVALGAAAALSLGFVPLEGSHFLRVPGPLFLVASIPLFLYVLLVAVTSFSFNVLRWLVTALGVFATHVTYGVRFVQGLCAKKAPCEFIGKDHL